MDPLPILPAPYPVHSSNLDGPGWRLRDAAFKVTRNECRPRVLLGLVVDVRKRIPSRQTHGGGRGVGLSMVLATIVVASSALKIACGAGGLGRRGR